MKAVVLAAGESTRLRPLTATRPKHMLPIAGKPVLEHLLLAIRRNGIKEINIVIGYRSEMIQKYFGDGKKFGLRLTYTLQDRPLGTADALRVAEEYVEGDYFLLIYGDIYVHASSIGSLLQKHLDTGVASIAVVPVKDPRQFGIIELRGEFVKRIIEKPKEGESSSNLANAGIYVLPKAIFRETSRTPTSPRSEFEITDTIQHLLEEGLPFVSKTIHSGTWLDIGRPWDLLEANSMALQRSPLEVEGTIEEGVRIVGKVGVEEGARIRTGSYLEGPVLIGGGSEIGPNTYIRPFTSIGRNVFIGNACEVKASLILDNSHVEHLSYVGDSIIGENCNLGAGTITANLRFDEDTVKMMVKSELADSGRRKLGSILGDNVKTGTGVNLMPGVKLGPNVWIGPNVTVYRDVAAGVFVTQKQNVDFRTIS